MEKQTGFRKKGEQAEQPNSDETIDADIECPHKAWRKVLQEPIHPHVPKQPPTCSKLRCAQRAHRDVYLPKSSDVREQIEVFIVFVLAALAEADGLLRLDEFDSLDPLDHLVAKLIFDAQPQWRSIDLGQGSPFISVASRHSALSTFSRLCVS